MIMNLTTQLSDARKWLNRRLSYDQDQDVNTFETTIRMLGGLLSAHYLSTQLPDVSSRRDYIYLTKATDLADRLLSAYDTKTGIPYASVNIGTRQGLPSHADGGASSTAEAATLQLEMKYLAHLTGNKVYWQKAEHIMKVKLHLTLGPPPGFQSTSNCLRIRCWIVTVCKTDLCPSSSTQTPETSSTRKYALGAEVTLTMVNDDSP